jgi:hypothetical protein
MSKFIFALFAVSGLLPVIAPVAKAETLYAITNGGFLVSFNSSSPSIVDFIDPITGLLKGQKIASLSFNAVTNEVFALGVKRHSDFGNLYELDLSDGVATPIDPTKLFPVEASPTILFSSPSTGTEYLATTEDKVTELYAIDPPTPSLTPLGKFANGAEYLTAATAVPEPGVVSMLLVGGIGMVLFFQVKRRLEKAEGRR